MKSPAPIILLVDDYADNRAMYARYLVYAGYRVDEATNGQEALDKAGEIHPDLIVMDLSLPVMDGWEFSRALDARDAHPPIVVLTAAPDPAARAAEVHADGWLGKPFEYEELEAMVRKFGSHPARWPAPPGPLRRTRASGTVAARRCERRRFPR